MEQGGGDGDTDGSLDLGQWAFDQVVELCKTILLILMDVLAVLALFGGLAIISEALKFFGGRFSFSETYQQYFHGMHEVLSFCSYTVLGFRSLNHLSRGFMSRLFNRLFRL